MNHTGHTAAAAAAAAPVTRRFSLPDSINADSSPCRRTPIFLNVYDLTPINNYLYWLGLGIFHTGIEVYDTEFAYGAHDAPTSGIFEVEPRSCPGFIFRRSISLGTTELGPQEVWDLMEALSLTYTGDSYNLLTKNCNHFTNEVCMKLIGRSSPGWVNRLAHLGTLCSCVLPETLQVSAVQHSSEYHSSEEFQGAVTEPEWSDVSDEDRRLLTRANAGIQVVGQGTH